MNRGIIPIKDGRIGRWVRDIWSAVIGYLRYLGTGGISLFIRLNAGHPSLSKDIRSISVYWNYGSLVQATSLSISESPPVSIRVRGTTTSFLESMSGAGGPCRFGSTMTGRARPGLTFKKAC